MYVVYKDENEENDSRRANIVGFKIHVGRFSRYMERECIRKLEKRNVGI